MHRKKTLARYLIGHRPDPLQPNSAPNSAWEARRYTVIVVRGIGLPTIFLVQFWRTLLEQTACHGPSGRFPIAELAQHASPASPAMPNRQIGLAGEHADLYKPPGAKNNELSVGEGAGLYPRRAKR